MEAAVSEEAVVQFLPAVASLARRFKGVGGAEYDDLYQEGSEKVVRLLMDGKQVSNTAIKNAMRDWVRKCASKGFTYELPAEA
jgi:hypothetical protein